MIAARGTLQTMTGLMGQQRGRAGTPWGLCGAGRLRGGRGQGRGWLRNALSPLGQCQLKSPACSTGWSCQPETGDCSKFAFILETSVSRACGEEGGHRGQLSSMQERRGLQPCPARSRGSGRWAGPAWQRNSGTEGSLGTRPALTACLSTLPAACQHQLRVGSAPLA